ncbi:MULTISPECIES: hypothetical protein [Clostridium]|jgi:hypothetical protein|nr:MULTISPECIES: hypothetical protein [Clostridium]NOW82918.1 hypothetical protein [Clostridium beijerinckii]
MGNKQADFFYSKIINTEVIKPSFIKFLTLKMQQMAFLKYVINKIYFIYY